MNTAPIISAQSDERLRGIWRGMVNRCTSQKNPAWGRYGGRGIKVCKEWLGYGPFRSWALRHGYSDRLSIERKDNDGNYCEENCRWATHIEQQNNRRNNLRFKLGRLLLTPQALAEVAGVSLGTMLTRIYKLKLRTGDRFPRRFLKQNLFRGAMPVLRLRNAEQSQLKKAA